MVLANATSAARLGQNGIHYVTLLTKSDKLKQNELARVRKASEGLLVSLGAREVIQISSVKGTGIETVWPALEDAGS